jgi:S-adenosylmethionine hydrolase
LALSNRIEGRVTEIDASGTLITDIPVDRVAGIPHDESVTIQFGDHQTLGIFPAEHDQPESTMVASMGNSGFLQIEIVGINLAEMLGIKVDESVQVKW